MSNNNFHVIGLYLPTGYCYQANDALEESDILREFVNFILAFRVCIYNAMCVITSHGRL